MQFSRLVYLGTWNNDKFAIKVLGWAAYAGVKRSGGQIEGMRTLFAESALFPGRGPWQSVG